MTRNACRGFSLLEVLVAFTILIMVFGALFEIFGRGVRAATVSERYSLATLIAQSRLAELAAEDSLSEGIDDGDAGRGYRWQSTIVPYVEPEGASFDGMKVKLWTVTVDVTWGEDEPLRSVSLSSLLLSGDG
jgi:general secretion pathway protein I